MNKILSLLPALLLASGMAHATSTDMPGMHMSGDSKPAKSAAQINMGHGVIKGIDEHAGKVTISHGPIKSLGWGAMTMAFPLKDKAALKHIRVGQKVDFDVVKGSNGQYLITRILPAK